MAMTLMDFVSNRAGTWSTAQGSRLNNLIELSQWDDAVTFQGPLHLNVAVVAQNVLTPLLSGGAARNSVNELYSYDLEIPAGYSWQYQMSESPAASRLLPAYKVIFRTSPCARVPAVQPPDLPCDFAVGNLPCVGEFFPVGCEPCGSGPVRMPPTCGPSLTVKPASGGCIRPRFFNGMFITREDLETELRYLRIKNKLQRRADGQGVVWGLGIRRQGSAVCVQPGYALDCCGNDLTVTSMYTVDSATLLSDPAICNQVTGRQQCMHLLLEYIECPEEPRPVHGDPCFGSASACEMSRVRETVRLRLVPPRDYKPASPIQKFLSTLSQGVSFSPAPSGGATPAPASNTTTPTSLPFQIQFSDAQTGAPTNPASQMALTPTPNGTTVSDVLPVLRMINESIGAPLITISIPATDMPFAFSSGAVTDDKTNKAPSLAANISTPTPAAPGPISWQVTLPNPDVALKNQWKSGYTVSWSAPAGSDPSSGVYSGTSTIQLAFAKPSSAVAPPATLNLTISIVTTATLSVPAESNSFPCLNDACCTGKPLFPVVPPWADGDPFHPGQAADPKVLALALIYALYAGTSAQANSTNGTQNSQVQTAAKLFQAAATLLDPAVAQKDPAELSKVTQAVQQLLNDWCCSFLYPGPTCDGEPHGVVIGCATIASGQIESISPWSGRRWVMHYPLVSYWGVQFGIVPPDVLASRLFSLICCLGSLPIPGIAVFDAAGRSDVSKEVAVGAGFLRIAAASSPQSATSSSAQHPSRALDLASFAARILSTLVQPAAPAGTPMADFTLAGFNAIHLRVPDESAGAIASAPAVLTDLVSQTLSQSASRTAVPPLLRDFAQSLTVQLAATTPISSLAPAEAVVEPLTAAGITNAGAVLARSPQSIYTEVLGRTHAAAVSKLLQKAEANASEVARTVVDAIKSTATARGLESTDDLTTTAAQTALARPIAHALHLTQTAVIAGIRVSLS